MPLPAAIRRGAEQKGSGSFYESGPPLLSRQSRVDHDVAGDLERTFIGIALTLNAGMSFESAADVVLGIDDDPVVVDLYALELRKIAATAGSLGVLDLREVGPDLDG